MIASIGKQILSVHRFGSKLQRNNDGTTAVEFALVSIPFFMLLFGILGICQLFFWIFTCENAVWTASRDLRTGTFQTQASGSQYAGLTGNALITQFKHSICNNTINATDCFNNSVVLVQSNANFSSIVAPSCTTNTNALLSNASAMAAFNAGASSSVVLVTLCYNWVFGATLPYLPLPKISSGGYLIQASAAFRTEPY